MKLQVIILAVIFFVHVVCSDDTVSGTGADSHFPPQEYQYIDENQKKLCESLDSIPKPFSIFTHVICEAAKCPQNCLS